MLPEDLKQCQTVVQNLKANGNNYLFLEPFDLSQTPGYTDVVEKVMDLATLSKNLEAGEYPDIEAFFKDCFRIYENAIAYHGNRDETKFVAKLAKQMLKVAQKAKNHSLKKKKAPPPKKTKKAADGGGTKLKLKLGGGGQADTPGKAKVSIKLNKSPDTTSPSGGQNQSKKPRLTLKLAKSKTGIDSSDGGAATPRSASSPGGSKLSIKLGGNSRGKELPEGVSPSPKKASKKRKDIDRTTSKSKKIKVKAVGSQLSLSPIRKAQCAKVLAGLKRRQQTNTSIFLQPVSDSRIINDYRSKIQHPMDLGTMQSKLEKDEYPTVASFVLDMRRIFANCLRYNTSIKDALRPVAVEVLSTGEQLMTVFLAKPEHPTNVYRPLLFCWKLCLSVLDTLYNLTNPSDGQPTALYFLFPVSFYCGGHFPADYLEKVKKPMDFGTVTKNLLEGNYSTIEEFETDCRLVIENCIVYYGGREDGKIFTEQANRLNAVLEQQMTALKKYLKSSTGERLRRSAQMAVSESTLPKPPVHLLLGILEELRGLNYTDRATKITEPAMALFEKPVPLSAFPDYSQKIKTPMDLHSVERKVKNALYGTPEDFEYDVLLIFQNCITYNSSRDVEHLVNLGKYGLKQFRRIFSSRMRAFDDPSSVPPPKESGKKTPPSSSVQGSPKNFKIEPGGASKIAPRISLSSAQIMSAAQRPKTFKLSAPKASGPKGKPNQPVPLHIAISQVKENFPLRRNLKALQPWEAACARFFKELMRHSWISAARPKFIFHVPVPVIFPELKEAYAAKIKKPMDLTTVECSLLAGNLYSSPEDFVNDVALVFSNAITFNKEGRDLGDPLPCAYYDASKHLLRYCRWLSFELLSEYVEESSHEDEPEDGGLPLSSWKLTTGNKKKAREEMERIVLNEVIEKSMEGDRYTWMEAECEKLMKALRHQSDFRYMRYFISPEYPADYTAYVSRPMDWERCQKALRKRQYDKFGDVMEDLRLIFSNAMKYNGRHAATDAVSGAFYDAAKYMATKLELAINKMMVAVSDRSERERIDHNNAEREIEAAERAEKERIRAQWGSDKPLGEVGEELDGVEISQRIRARSRTILRRETDFEVPFFDDEDDGKHERSYFDVMRQQKAMFERQRLELSKMQQSAAGVGSSLFLRMLQNDQALKWMDGERKKVGITIGEKGQEKDKGSSNEKRVQSEAPTPSSLAMAGTESRPTIELKLSKPKPKKKRKKAKPAFSFED